MTDTYDITGIRTGEGFDGRRVAVISAPEQAPAGSLESLTRFFLASGYDAQLGYAGAEKRHVLRLHGLPSDEALLGLLHREYPAWENKQDIAARPHGAYIRFPENLAFQPLEDAPAAQKRGFIRSIRDRSTDIAALSYSAGNIGLVFSALYGNRQSGEKELLKLGAPLCYTMASSFLFFLNRQRPEPRSMEAIWDSLAPTLLREDCLVTPEEAAATRAMGSEAVSHVWEFMKKHPWEVSGLLNIAGAGTHMTSSFLRGQPTEALSALSTLTAMAITTFVPEKGKSGAFGTFAAVPEDVTLSSFNTLEEHHGLFQPVFDAGKKLLGQIQENPLRAASFIQLAANSGYGVAALNKKDAEGNRAVDYGLLASSGTYITGNGFQAIATKTKGPSFDDVVSTAARAIAKQTDWKQGSPDALEARISHIAKTLAKQPEISHSARMLSGGIRERIASAREDTPLGGFIASEREALRESPFIAPRQLEQALRQHATPEQPSR